MTNFLDGSPGVIVAGGFTFNAVDDDGLKWTLDKVDGWHDGPSVDVEQTQRIVSHGQFAQSGRRGGRQIIWSGSIQAPHDDHGLLANAAERLATFLADGGFGTFEFIDANLGSRWTTVQLLDTPDLSLDTDDLSLAYQISVLASSPYKYGVESTASTGFAAAPSGTGLVFPLFAPDGELDFGALADVGQASVTNYGTASAPVTFTITGPTPEAGFVITDTTSGERIEFLGQVPAGSVLVINSANGSIVIDGTADRLGDALVDSWFSVPAGETRTYLFEPNGSATASTLTVSAVSAYW